MLGLPLTYGNLYHSLHAVELYIPKGWPHKRGAYMYDEKN